MPIDASIPLHIFDNEVNPVDNFMRAAQLAHQIQINQSGQLEIQARQQQMEDDQRLRDVMRNSYDNQGNFSWDKFKQLAPRSGISPTAFQTLEKGHADAVEKLATTDKTQLENIEKAHDIFRGYTNQVMQAPPEQRPTLWQWGVQRAKQEGLLKPGEVPDQYPGDARFEALHNSLAVGSQITKEAIEKQNANSATSNAQTAAGRLDYEKSGATRPVEQKEMDDWISKNPGKGPADFMEYKAKLVPQFKMQMGGGDARSDRSYQFNSKQLEAVGKPITDANQRLGRLQDALAQGTPQADALIAPELLTVMAGGQGSGLRMNEAEISRIVGGRSKWQNLQASINQWSADPSKANSITPEQRQQIRSLVSEVSKKLQAKQTIIDDANQQLINETDPIRHRQVVADAKRKLSQIDQASSGPAVGAIEDGFKFKGGDPKNPGNWEKVATQ